MDFTLDPGAYRYRPLKLTAPTRQRGWDVYALQTALAGIPGYADLEADGIFGKLTDTAVRNFQGSRTMLVDGIAGTATQTGLCQVLSRQFRKGWDLPNGIPYGHVESESGGQLGNHTAPYPNGSRDCGIVQRNTTYAPMVEGFDAPDSLMVLSRRVSDYWIKYEGYGVVSSARALALACGSWNAPAWTDTLAKGGTLSQVNRDWIEAYITRVTSYVDFSAL